MHENDRQRPRKTSSHYRSANSNTRNIYSDSSRQPKRSGSPTGRRKKKRRKPIIISAFLTVFILLLVGVGTIFALNMLNKIDRKDRNDFEILQSVPEMTDDEFVSGGTGDGDDLHLSYASGEMITNKSISNILLIGCDADDEYGYGRSDSAMLVSIDNKHKKLKMTSFLRDTYLKIPGLQDNRLNYSYSCGGPGLLIQTIEQNFRVKIDYYVKVTFSSILEDINTLGGVNIDLTQDEADLLNSIYDDDRCEEGMNTLDGGYALNYARIRELDSDYGRTQRQKNVIDALIAKFKSSSVSRMLEVLNMVGPMIQTDMSNGDLTGFATQAPTIMQYPTSHISIPKSELCEDRTIRNMQVLVPDIEANKDAVWKFIYE